MFLFFLRKLIASFLYPPTFCLLIVFAGAILLAIGKAKRVALGLLFGGLGALFLLSIPALQQPFLRLAEFPPAESEQGPAEAIVVLGAGTRAWDEPVPSTRTLGATSLARAVEGIRLARKFPDLPLIFTGGRIGVRPPSSEAMASLALDLGIAPSRIITFDSPTSTAGEARRTAEEIGPQTIFLVTSALHLPRAIELFRREGISPLPSPADYLSDDSSPGFLDFLPNAGSWKIWQQLFHEIYGRAWARISD